MEYDRESEANERCDCQTKSNISASVTLQTNIGNSGDLNHSHCSAYLGTGIPNIRLA